jgi:hypothetical protein
MARQFTVVGFALAFSLTLGSGAEAQQNSLPLAPIKQGGEGVAPFFEGWYRNADGTYTLSFGYFNRNAGQLIEIPIGSDNSIVPAQYDGNQPTSFPPVNYGGFSARRERGVFSVTVPADFGDREVVWSLRQNGQTFSVPGRINSPAYELSHEPMAMGSKPPLVRFQPGGKAGQGITGITADPVTARVGTPVTLSIWAEDQGVRERKYPVTVTWQKHQGPGKVEFTTRSARVESDGKMTTQAVFDTPGEYIVRARADNFTAPDSTFGDQCCWTNGYVRVTVR